MHGHLGRSELAPKHSFRLLFKKAYGPAKLEYDMFPGSPATSFDTLVLRAGNNESYAGYPGWKNRLATYARDEWLRRSQLAISGFGARGRYVHLYLNGLYWGVYNLVEHPDSSFAAGYFGGDKENWFFAQPSGADTGILERFSAMRRLAEVGGMADPARYAAMEEYIDPVEFSDYLVLHWYAGSEDWPENNWNIAAKSEGKFRFLTWDGELTWKDGADVQLHGDGKPDIYFPNVIKRVFNALLDNPDFRLTLADRIYKLTTLGGALSDAEAKARWMEITGELEPAIVAESARWGDAWFEQPITEGDWREGCDSVLNQMTDNSARLLAQARAQGYYPLVDPPAFGQESGRLMDNRLLTMTAAQGDIYYTTDGTDPRVRVTGAISPGALPYTGPIELSSSTRVRARTFDHGVWSALHEADYVDPEEPSGLRITKLMYHPQGGKDYEFLELSNVGGLEMDLSGATFEGIELSFPYPTRLGGASSMMLVADAARFRERYGDIPIAAEFGGELANAGERIQLRSASGELLLSLTYDDENDWPLTPDGKGDWLVLTNLAGDMNDHASWRASDSADGRLQTWDKTSAEERGEDAEQKRDTKPFNPLAAQPFSASNVRFGDDLLLAGYGTYLNGQPLAKDKLPALLPGDVLEYVLYWRGGQLKGKEVYIKLLTPTGELVAEANRAIGMHLQPLAEVPNGELIPDRYTLSIPPSAAGLIQPVLHIYVPDTGTRLPVFSHEGVKSGEDYPLPVLKIDPSGPAPVPQYPLYAEFGDQIELLGYTLNSPYPALKLGQPMTVTLYFKAKTPLGKDLLRSLQLHSAEDGMAAQNDSKPARGDNPTWAWRVGEVVADEVRLDVQPGNVTGKLHLLLTIYDPADGKRLPVRDETGNLQPDQILLLREVAITE
ncbi:MAG: CotH kinase family protein [Nitrososphaerales archaeon]